MDIDEIIKLLGVLVGDIEPYGEKYHDKKTKDNIEKLGEIITLLIDDIGTVALNFHNSCYASEDRCAEKGIEILSAISKSINDILTEVGGEKNG